MFQEVFFCDFGNNTGKNQKGDQVRNCHQTVQSVRNIPHECSGTDGADNANKSEYDLIDLNKSTVVIREITPAVFTVVSLGKNSVQSQKQ